MFWLASCGASAVPTPTAIPPGLVNLPVELSPSFPPHPDGPLLCALTGFDNVVLHGSPTTADPVWVTDVDHPDVRFVVRWPAGFRARFSPGLELVDPSGSVVAREGAVLTDIGADRDADGRIAFASFNGTTYPPCS